MSHIVSIQNCHTSQFPDARLTPPIQDSSVRQETQQDVNMDKLKNAKDSITGKTAADQPAQKPTDANKDIFNQEVDKYANKKGVPAGANPEINSAVNDEINKF
ncbi:hypothetical protein GGR57DRAFT_499831 [Xylariaceae sp. FL1272]|nr:hypothetical protein GGR57DRAFT_499831 [Xylariaceae sp. FL1272]